MRLNELVVTTVGHANNNANLTLALLGTIFLPLTWIAGEWDSDSVACESGPIICVTVTGCTACCATRAGTEVLQLAGVASCMSSRAIGRGHLLATQLPAYVSMCVDACNHTEVCNMEGLWQGEDVTGRPAYATTAAAVVDSIPSLPLIPFVLILLCLVGCGCASPTARQASTA
jgi:hypothetical protein